MTSDPDDDSLRTFVVYQGTYHNHKEQLGYLAAALYVSGAVWLFFGQGRWSSYPSWAKGPFLALLFVTGAMGLFYVFWQFHLRSIAASRIDEFLAKLKWPKEEQCCPLFQRWAAPGTALALMLLWGAAAFVRVARSLWP